MNGTAEHNVKQNKPGTVKEVSHLSHMRKLKKR
jgi:hypothetical protein